MENEKRRLTIIYGKMLLKIELPKFLLLILFFWSIHKLTDFFFALLFFIPIRMCAGGLHFKSNRICFLFSFVFFAAVLCILSKMLPPNYLQILVISVLLFAGFAPAYNPKKPCSRKHTMRLKICATCFYLLMTIIIILLLNFGPIKYGLIGFWILILQTIQLVIAAITSGSKKGANYVK